MSDKPTTTPMRTPGWTQEAILGSDVDAYLETLEQILASAEPRARNDPTLAVALSVSMLGLLVREVRALREAAALAGPGADRPREALMAAIGVVEAVESGNAFDLRLRPSVLAKTRTLIERALSETQGTDGLALEREAVVHAIREGWQDALETMSDEVNPPGESTGFERGIEHADRLINAVLARAALSRSETT